MKGNSFTLLSAAALLLLALFAPGLVLALDLTVLHDPDSDDDTQFSSIQAAIESARNRLISEPNTTFRIVVQASSEPYRGSFTPIARVPIIGESTAGTFLELGGAGTIVNLSGVTGLAIRNFTFRNATLAISMTNSQSITISNNVFQMGASGTGVQVRNSPTDISIRNNTFYSNGTALSTDSDVLLTNNIFASNQVAIDTTLTLSLLSYSDFFANTRNGVTSLGTNSIPNVQVADANPDFVDPGRNFRLQAGSPAKASGNPLFTNSFDRTTSDMGAFGGPESDASLPAVSGIVTQEIPPDSIGVSWNPSADSSVSAYRVYFGPAPRASSGNSYPNSQLVAVPASSTVLSNLPVTTPATPATPSQVALTSLPQALQVTWNAVEGATGYRVYYRPLATFDQDTLGSASFLDVAGGGSTSTVIPGLSNGTDYFVAVAARAQTPFYIAVTAVINADAASAPGSLNESPFSQEKVQGVGGVESPISSRVDDFPEGVSPHPNLAHKGCFIATAAYGCYSAPQVQALREFRDRYLMNCAPGRAFVAWYYRCGPRGAQFINDHPWLKPPVRLALLPLIALALVLLKTTALGKTALLAVALLAWAGLSRRIRAHQGRRRDVLARSGGAR